MNSSDDHLRLTQDDGKQWPQGGLLVFLPSAALREDRRWESVVRVVRNDYGKLCAILLTCIAGSLAYLMLSAPIYRAQVTLMPVENSESQGLLAGMQSQLGGLASLAGIGIGSTDGPKQEALATLASHSFTSQFIQDEELLPILMRDRLNGSKRWWVFWGGADAPTLEDAFELFDRDVRFVSEDRRNGIVIVAIEWTDRNLAASWANSLVAALDRDLRKRARAQAERSLKYLETELTRTTAVAVREVIFRMMELERRRIMLTFVREHYAFRVIDPAHAPQADRPVRPRPALILILGALLGCLAGLLFIGLRARGGRPGVEPDESFG